MENRAVGCLVQIEGHTLWGPALSAHSVVLDLGANKGNFSHEVLKRFHCRCVAVEANPHLCQAIPPHPNLSVHNLAVAARSGTLPFHLSPDNSEESSLLTSAKSEKSQTIEVEATRLDDLLNRAGLKSVDVIKFDIEGAEIEVLDATSDDLLRSVGQLTIEFHDFLGLTPVATVKRLVDRLDGLGFYPIRMWREAWGDTLFINRRLATASGLKLAWSRYVTRNWWGFTRVVRRAVGSKPQS